jgi:hypothetical protein
MKGILISLALLPLIACANDRESEPEGPGSQASTEKAEQPYVAEAEQRLQELESKVGDIKEAIADQVTVASEDLEVLIDDLDRKREGAAEQIAALREAGEAGWESASLRTEQVLDDLESAVAEAWDRIHS